MGVADGQEFTCDRADDAHEDGVRPRVFMLPTDKAREDWTVNETWTDINGVEIHCTLCPECTKEWQAIKQEQRQKAQNFMYLGLER